MLDETTFARPGDWKVRIWIPGKPVRWQRATTKTAKNPDGTPKVYPKIDKKTGKPHPRAGQIIRWSYNPEEVKLWQATAMQYAEAALRAAGLVPPAFPKPTPVELQILCLWPMKGQPLKRSRRPRAPKTTTPDADNLAKNPMDAFEGLLWENDSQVVFPRLLDLHARQGEAPGVLVEARELLFDPDRLLIDIPGQPVAVDSEGTAEKNQATFTW